MWRGIYLVCRASRHQYIRFWGPNVSYPVSSGWWCGFINGDAMPTFHPAIHHTYYCTSTSSWRGLGRGCVMYCIVRYMFDDLIDKIVVATQQQIWVVWYMGACSRDEYTTMCMMIMWYGCGSTTYWYDEWMAVLMIIINAERSCKQQQQQQQQQQIYRRVWRIFIGRRLWLILDETYNNNSHPTFSPNGYPYWNNTYIYIIYSLHSNIIWFIPTIPGVPIVPIIV